MRALHQAKLFHQSRIPSSPAFSSHPTSLSSPSLVPSLARNKMIDIAVNLTDPTFRGLDRKNKQIHINDFEDVLKRARVQGVEKIIVSGTSLKTSRAAVELCRAYPGFLYCTVGCHPAESKEFQKQEGVLEALRSLAEASRDVVVAIGETGLDYSELKACPKDVQLQYFEAQFSLAETTRLPMFLHSREVGMDFVNVVKKNRHRFSSGVVHSFTGSPDELKELLLLDLSIGVNGCSLRTEDQLKLVKDIPLERLMLETDAPWCDVQPAHAGFKFVKTFFPACPKDKFEPGSCVLRRTEPAHLIQVCEILAGIHDLHPEDIAEATYRNTSEMFFKPQDKSH